MPDFYTKAVRVCEMAAEIARLDTDPTGPSVAVELRSASRESVVGLLICGQYVRAHDEGVKFSSFSLNDPDGELLDEVISDLQGRIDQMKRATVAH